MKISGIAPIGVRFSAVAAALLACSAGAGASMFELRQPLQGVVAVPAAAPSAPAPVPLASVSPNAFEFLPTNVGAATAPVAVSVVNEGEVAVDIAGAELAPPFSIVSRTCASTLAVGESCTFSVAFSPLDAVGFSERLLVSTNAGVLAILLSGTGVAPPPEGNAAFTAAGTYSFVVPAGVYTISAVAVGGGGGGGGGSSGAGNMPTGGGGGGGGGLSYVNGLAVQPGQTLTVTVGAAGSGGAGAPAFTAYAVGGLGTAGKASAIVRDGSVLLTAAGGAGGGANGNSGGPGGIGGAGSAGTGGRGGAGISDGNGGGGGGVAGYSGQGGTGGGASTAVSAGAGGGGGGGGRAGSNSSGYHGGAGGGVGLNGQGANGAQGSANGNNGVAGGAGSGGSSVQFGGGGYGGNRMTAGSAGGVGAVRIIWGPDKSYPYNAN